MTGAAEPSSRCGTCDALVVGSFRFCTSCGAAMPASSVPKIVPTATPSAWSGLGVPASATSGFVHGVGSDGGMDGRSGSGADTVSRRATAVPPQAAPFEPTRSTFVPPPTTPVAVQAPVQVPVQPSVGQPGGGDAGGRRPRRSVMLLGVAAVAAVAVIAVVATRGGSDESRFGSTGLAAVRSDPTGDIVRFETDSMLRAAEMWGDVLLLDTVLPDSDAYLSEIVAVDPRDGRRLWQHDATSYQVFEDRLILIDDGELREIDRSGREVRSGSSVRSDYGYVWSSGARLLLTDDSGMSTIDPSSLDLVVRDLDPSSLSPAGRFALRTDFDSGEYDDGETTIEVVDLRDGDEVAERFTVDGSPSVRALDDGRIVAVIDGDLHVLASDGSPLGRIRLDDGVFLGGVLPGDLVSVYEGNQMALYDVSGTDVTEVPGGLPDGYMYATDRADRWAFRDDGRIELGTVDGQGFTSTGLLRGDQTWFVDGVCYLRDRNTLEAYSSTDLDRPLWSMRLRDGQYVQPLDGKIAVFEYDWEDSTTSFEVYG